MRGLYKSTLSTSHADSRLIAVLAATSTTYEGALIAKTHHDKYHRGFERSRE